MAESRYTVTTKDLFIFYRNKEHILNQEQKEEDDKKSYNQEKGFHSTKIHICLSEEAFINFKTALIKILVPYLEQGTIVGFKLIQENEFKETSKRLASKLTDPKLFERTRAMLQLKKKNLIDF